MSILYICRSYSVHQICLSFVQCHHCLDLKVFKPFYSVVFSVGLSFFAVCLSSKPQNICLSLSICLSVYINASVCVYLSSYVSVYIPICSLSVSLNLYFYAWVYICCSVQEFNGSGISLANASIVRSALGGDHSKDLSPVKVVYCVYSELFRHIVIETDGSVFT